jgi:lysophospholipase L1-like esterase
VAGVGVTDHLDGLTGAVVRTLAQGTGQAVHWQVLARSGYTAQRVLTELVGQLPATAFDIILVGLGGNDTFDLSRPLTFRRHLRQLIRQLQLRQPQARIVIASLPPVGDFPAFPQPLRFVLGGLARLHEAVIRDVPPQFARVYYVDKPIRFQQWAARLGPARTITDFFSDGVHPSSLTYTVWGKEIADYMLQHKVA